MKTIFVVCQHGNEKLPYKVIKKLTKLKYLLANQAAFEKNVRFVETDLNRSFPGDSNGTLEEKLANKLVEQLKEYDQVIDLHTATCETPIFAILTKVTQKHLDLVRKLGIRKVVVMRKSIASGKALIDHVEVGISIECGHEQSDQTRRDIGQMLVFYGGGNLLNDSDFECYEVFDVLKRQGLETLPNHIVNFVECNYGGKTFVPILARETSYKEVLSLMARKVRLEELCG